MLLPIPYVSKFFVSKYEAIRTIVRDVSERQDNSNAVENTQ
jgi:hypothetical protein